VPALADAGVDAGMDATVEPGPDASAFRSGPSFRGSGCDCSVTPSDATLPSAYGACVLGLLALSAFRRRRSR